MTNWKHVIVTGASRGLGAEFSRIFAADGHNVSLFARSVESLKALVSEIELAGGSARYFTCDVAIASSVKDAMEKSFAAFGPIDILINNAGIVEPIESVRKAEPELWRKHIEINLVGAFHVLHFAAPKLARGAVVVNVSSGAAFQSVKGRSAYCAGKAGLNALSGVFAIEEAVELGARVFAFTPGPSETGMHEEIRSAPINQCPSFKPLSTRPVEDAAAFLRWLCSDAAADLAGQFVDACDPEMRRRAGLD